MQVFLISYIPMFREDPFNSSLQLKEFDNLLEASHDGRIEACIWFIKDNKPFPVFVIPDMDLIVDHLMEWSENKPLKWFELNICSMENSYAIALIPNMKKSIERWKITNQLMVGYPVPKDTEFKIFFKPLNFISSGETSFHKVKDEIGDKLQVGFIDLKNVNRESPSQIKEEDIRTIGPFMVNRDTNLYDSLSEIGCEARTTDERVGINER